MLEKAYQIKLYQSLEAAAKGTSIIRRVPRPYCGKIKIIYDNIY